MYAPFRSSVVAAGVLRLLPQPPQLALLSLLLLTPLASLISQTAHAGGVQGTPEQVNSVTITALNSRAQIGLADSANQGMITAEQLENRPLARTGELLEAVPGMIVTQHSGDGKANQYYVRGFNLDHGTDFRTSVLGMPVNMLSHAHGQGYSDLNFVIPELVSTIQYKKGTYYAEEGDFSAAGAAAFDYKRRLEQGLMNLEIGQYRYHRLVFANSTQSGPGNLLYALEVAGQDGPWQLPERYQRVNAVLSYSWKSGADDVRISAMGLDSSWHSTDQIPQRAITTGLVDRYGALDPSDGGNTARYSLSLNWKRQFSDGSFRSNAYMIRSRLDLYSNFTYSLDDRIQGDQFNQSEKRTVIGWDGERKWRHQLAGFDSETNLGLQLRTDRLSPVGLYSTRAQQRLSTTREDRINEATSALYLSNTTQWTGWFRTLAGLRADRYSFEVISDLSANSGQRTAHIVSPKLSLIFSPDKTTELYANWGQGFHSNDARGVTQTTDPKTGLTTDADGQVITRATPLVKATGKEIGLRLTGLAPHLQTSISLWRLDLASELLFVGDAGNTEASRPSRRTGLEIANYYTPVAGWIIDADIALSRARFRNADLAGPYIPGAIERTASIGLSATEGPWSGGLRLRYFGGRPLIEDNSVRSGASTLVNAKLAYAINKKIKVTAEVINVLNRQVSDVDYYYASQLPSESAPVNDIHTHPAEPRVLRIGLHLTF
ncbi:TonB-dependent receptor [Undibacterium sp. RuTC16W]|uniref:TonB-dependent receptor n=1 Tax=Undibacterium sp. RuTC16W TaxID=3413048 RepID=UPI003BEF579F